MFVETGTYKGNTARWAAKNFSKVITIEKDDQRYSAFKQSIDGKINNIDALHGDSSSKIETIVNLVKGQKTLYWLDAHPMQVTDASDKLQIPLLQELRHILTHKTEVFILIDDARFILSHGLCHYNGIPYPDMTDITDLVKNVDPDYTVSYCQDNLLIVPTKHSTDVAAILSHYSVHEEFSNYIGAKLTRFMPIRLTIALRKSYKKLKYKRATN